jgi:hypothetical protein
MFGRHGIQVGAGGKAPFGELRRHQPPPTTIQPPAGVAFAWQLSA